MRRQSGLISRAGGVAGLVNEYTGHNMIFPGHIDYTARTSAPPGWLPCDGRALSRTVYASLFAAIDVTYGAGDGSTTFNIPDDRGEFIRGADMGRGIDAGRVQGSLQSDALQGHGHNISAVTSGGTKLSDGTGSEPATKYPAGAAGGANFFKAFGLFDTGNGAPRIASETRPRNRAYLTIIKY